MRTDAHRARKADLRLEGRAGRDEFAFHHITRFIGAQVLSADQMPRSSRKRSIGASVNCIACKIDIITAPI
jgi:hypothetical protein